MITDIINVDEYFRTKARDLHYIMFNVFGPDDEPRGKSELIAWLKEFVPGATIAPIITEEAWEHSISVDFDDDELAIYCEEWEDEDGESNSVYFTRFCVPFAKYELFSEAGCLSL